MYSGIIKSAPVSSANFRSQLPGRKRKKIGQRFLLKVFIVVCYFSLLIFSTAELTSFGTRCASRALLTIIVIIMIMIIIITIDNNNNKNNNNPVIRLSDSRNWRYKNK